jgi:hypothetical protein
LTMKKPVTIDITMLMAFYIYSKKSKRP